MERSAILSSLLDADAGTRKRSQLLLANRCLRGELGLESIFPPLGTLHTKHEIRLCGILSSPLFKRGNLMRRKQAPVFTKMKRTILNVVLLKPFFLLTAKIQGTPPG